MSAIKKKIKKALLMQMDTSGWWLRTWLGSLAGTTKLLRKATSGRNNTATAASSHQHTRDGKFISQTRAITKLKLGRGVLAEGEDEPVSLVGS